MIENSLQREILELHLTGNIVPSIWYKTIKKSTGKAAILSINILSDVIYWYRPIEIRNQESGDFVEYRNKFHGDVLQKSYRQYSDFFGVSERQIKSAIDLLVKKGLVKRFFRNIILENGTHLSNVMYIEPVVGEIKKITYDQQIKSIVKNGTDEQETSPDVKELTRDEKLKIKDAKEIIEYLNYRLSTKYQIEANYKKPLARINEGYSRENCIEVIDKMIVLWKGSEMERYLTPDTLFRNGNKKRNFERYLNIKTKNMQKKENVSPKMRSLFENG